MKTATWAVCGTWLTGATGPQIQLCSPCPTLCLGTHRATCKLSHVLAGGLATGACVISARQYWLPFVPAGEAISWLFGMM